MHLDKNFLIEKIAQIRAEIGHQEVELDIYDYHFEQDSKELLIITHDRPGKSAVIGKGGWVVGRLKEELGLNSIHVEDNSDLMLHQYRMKLSHRKLAKILTSHNSPALENLSKLLERRISYPYKILSLFDEINLVESEKNENKSIVALSGGVDSSFSLIIAKLLGFNPIAVTVNPGNIILPIYFRNNIETLCSKLNVPHKYLDLDLHEVVEGSLAGRFHPCGRCSKLIEKTIYDYALKRDMDYLFYGDLLSTGDQGIVTHDKLFRINLPALLSATKGEIKDLVKKWGIKSKSGYGCPLLKEVQKKHPSMRRYSVQRILRETRAGILEPGEALDMVMRLI